MALARKVVSGEEDETETVEEVFGAARNAEATAEELLVDDGWKLVEVEPETVAVNGNGHHDAIGPTVELVPVSGQANGNGHTPAPANGNGHHACPGQRQRPPRRGPGAAADALLLGRVHGRGAGEAQGPQAEAPARYPLDVRVGAHAGAGARGRAGRRGTLGRNWRGEDVACRRPLPAHPYMRPSLRFRTGRVARRFSVPPPQPGRGRPACPGERMGRQDRGG